jgi:hypothetical protein
VRNRAEDRTLIVLTITENARRPGWRHVVHIHVAARVAERIEGACHER